jgi:hypothetical protein
MWTIPLPGSLEETLAENEADPTHVPAARAALEDALAWQLRAVALGMLADRLMQKEAGNRPGRAVWWHQYTQETAGKLVFWPPDEDDDGFRRFRREIAQQVARRDIVRITPAEVTDGALRVLGGHVGLCDEGRVNAELMALGSACRYLVEPGRKLRAVWAAKLAGLPSRPVDVKPVFIFGEVAPATAIGRIRFLRFVAERAASPHENAASPLFYADGRLVARDFSVSDILDYPLYAHEFGHVWQDLIENPRRGIASWRAVVRQDLCVYLRQARTADEIQRAFFPAWMGPNGELESHVMPRGSWFPEGEEPTGNPIAGLVSELVEDGLVEREAGRFVCRLYEEGRRWLV